VFCFFSHSDSAQDPPRWITIRGAGPDARHSDRLHGIRAPAQPIVKGEKQHRGRLFAAVATSRSSNFPQRRAGGYVLLIVRDQDAVGGLVGEDVKCCVNQKERRNRSSPLSWRSLVDGEAAIWLGPVRRRRHFADCFVIASVVLFLWASRHARVSSWPLYRAARSAKDECSSADWPRLFCSAGWSGARSIRLEPSSGHRDIFAAGGLAASSGVGLAATGDACRGAAFVSRTFSPDVGSGLFRHIVRGVSSRWGRQGLLGALPGWRLRWTNAADGEFSSTVFFAETVGGDGAAYEIANRFGGCEGALEEPVARCFFLAHAFLMFSLFSLPVRAICHPVDGAIRRSQYGIGFLQSKPT